MNHLVIGRGEIGKAVMQLVGERESDTVCSYDIDGGIDRVAPQEIGIMHVCFPWNEDFVKQVREYIVQYQPRHILVWSTVGIGTVRAIKHNAVHSPVEGKHPKLYLSMKLMRRWLGSTSRQELKFFTIYFEGLGLATREVMNPEATEALKLLSTTKYGINLVFADYVDRVLADIGADFDLSKQWDKDYNVLYKALKLPQFQKYVLDAPEGRIGGHCVRENALILADEYDDDLLDLITEMKGANDE